MLFEHYFIVIIMESWEEPVITPLNGHSPLPPPPPYLILNGTEVYNSCANNM